MCLWGQRPEHRLDQRVFLLRPDGVEQPAISAIPPAQASRARCVPNQTHEVPCSHRPQRSVATGLAQTHLRFDPLAYARPLPPPALDTRLPTHTPVFGLPGLPAEDDGSRRRCHRSPTWRTVLPPGSATASVQPVRVWWQRRPPLALSLLDNALDLVSNFWADTIRDPQAYGLPGSYRLKRPPVGSSRSALRSHCIVFAPPPISSLS